MKMPLDVARNKFENWKKRRGGREYLAVLFVEAKGKCPRCGCFMVLSYQQDAEDNRATFNHKIPLAKTLEIEAIDHTNLEILCRKCNHIEGKRFEQELYPKMKSKLLEVDELPQS